MNEQNQNQSPIIEVSGLIKVYDLNSHGKIEAVDEADQLCDCIAIMDHGKIHAMDTPHNLKKMVPGGNRIELELRECPGGLVDELNKIGRIGGIDRRDEEDKIILSIHGGRSLNAGIMKAVQEAHAGIAILGYNGLRGFMNRAYS